MAKNNPKFFSIKFIKVHFSILFINLILCSPMLSSSAEKEVKKIISDLYTESLIDEVKPFMQNNSYEEGISLIIRKISEANKKYSENGIIKETHFEDQNEFNESNYKVDEENPFQNSINQNNENVPNININQRELMTLYSLYGSVILLYILVFGFIVYFCIENYKQRQMIKELREAIEETKHQMNILVSLREQVDNIQSSLVRLPLIHNYNDLNDPFRIRNRTTSHSNRVYNRKFEKTKKIRQNKRFWN